jgi:hypothetical protein
MSLSALRSRRWQEAYCIVKDASSDIISRLYRQGAMYVSTAYPFKLAYLRAIASCFIAFVLAAFVQVYSTIRSLWQQRSCSTTTTLLCCLGIPKLSLLWSHRTTIIWPPMHTLRQADVRWKKIVRRRRQKTLRLMKANGTSNTPARGYIEFAKILNAVTSQLPVLRSTLLYAGKEITTGSKRLRRVELGPICGHNSSAVYGCDKCLIPAYSFHRAGPVIRKDAHAFAHKNKNSEVDLAEIAGEIVSAGGSATDLQQLQPKRTWLALQFLERLGTLHSIWSSNQSTLTPLSPSSPPDSSAYEILLRPRPNAHPKMVIPHGRISARAFWWGYTVYFPRPTLDHLGKSISVALASVGMASSFMVAIPTVLGPFLAPLASFIILEGALCRGVDKGFGISVHAFWGAPFVFIPTPLSSPRLFLMIWEHGVEDWQEHSIGTRSILPAENQSVR